jgi:predicted nucleotide-binding protein with TIR-like domain
MEQSRILISCNARTLVLAGKLRDELHKGDCKTALWSDDARSQSSAALLELFDRAAEQFDFAAIILVKDDVKVTEIDDPLCARDTYDFQAGLFMAKVGRERCFLVNSIGDSAMPSHLGGIICLVFEEPADLTDPVACEKAVAGVAAELRDRIAQQGNSPYYVRVPNLSVAEVLRKERHCSEGGELQQGEVVVCDTQPMPQESLAVQVRRNMDNAICYTYFLYFSIDTIEKICRSLQVILVAGVAGAEPASDFSSRMSVVKSQKDRILEDLRNICHYKRLQVTLLFQEPSMSFRIHNASNRELARLYARYRDQCFIPWSEGPSAESVWRSLPAYLSDNGQDRLFVSLKVFEDNKEQRELFESSLDRAVGRYFPGIEAEVKRLLAGGPS